MTDSRTTWDPATGFERKPLYEGDSGRFVAGAALLPQELGPHFFGQLSLRVQLAPDTEVTLDLKGFKPTSDTAQARAKSVGAWRSMEGEQARRASARFGAWMGCEPPEPRAGGQMTIPVHAQYLGVVHAEEAPWHVLALRFGWGTGGELVVHFNQKLGRSRWHVRTSTPELLMWQLTHALHHVRPEDVPAGAPMLHTASEVFEVDAPSEVCVRAAGAWWVIEGEERASLCFAPVGQNMRAVHEFEGVLLGASFARDANAAILLVWAHERAQWHHVRWSEGPQTLDVQPWAQAPSVQVEGVTLAMSPDGALLAVLEEGDPTGDLKVFDLQGDCVHHEPDPWGAYILWGWDHSGLRFTTADPDDPAPSQRWRPGQPFSPTQGYRLCSPDGAHRVLYDAYGLTHEGGAWRVDYVLESELSDLSPLVPEGPELARWIDPNHFFLERDVAPAHAIDVATGERRRLWSGARPFAGWYELAMHQGHGVCFGEDAWVWVRTL